MDHDRVRRCKDDTLKEVTELMDLFFKSQTPLGSKKVLVTSNKMTCWEISKFWLLVRNKCILEIKWCFIPLKLLHYRARICLLYFHLMNSNSVIMTLLFVILLFLLCFIIIYRCSFAMSFMHFRQILLLLR